MINLSTESILLVNWRLFALLALELKKPKYSTGIIFTFFKRRQTACWDKHREFRKVKSTLNDDQLNQ